MACNLCHNADGHKDSCPTRIRVPWESSGSIWESLARTLFELYTTAELNAISDRGTPEDERKLDDFVRHCKRALEDGDPYTVVELIRAREG